MDNNKLRYFLTICETESYRKAAEILRLSPAALSKAMRLLEDELGVALFSPNGRGIAITDDGLELARRAKPLLNDLDTLSQEIFQARETRQKCLRIGSFEVFTTYFATQLIRHLPPDFEMSLYEFVPGELERNLAERKIDFGLTYVPIPAANIRHERIGLVEMGIYGHKKYLAVDNFDELPFVVPVQPIGSVPTKVQGLDGWPDDRILRKIKYKVTLMESALELCRSALAVAYLPSFVVQLHNAHVVDSCKLLPLKAPPRLGSRKVDVYFVTRVSEVEGEVYKKIVRAVRLGLKGNC